MSRAKQQLVTNGRIVVCALKDAEGQAEFERDTKFFMREAARRQKCPIREANLTRYMREMYKHIADGLEQDHGPIEELTGDRDATEAVS